MLHLFEGSVFVMLQRENEPHRYVQNVAINWATKFHINRRSGSTTNSFWNDGVLNQTGLGEKIVWTGSGWAFGLIRHWQVRIGSRSGFGQPGHGHGSWTAGLGRGLGGLTARQKQVDLTWLLHGSVRPVYMGAVPAMIELWRRLWRVQQVPKTA